MQFFRKFYDVAVAEAPTSTDTAASAEQPSVAQMMAKQGRRTEGPLVEQQTESRQEATKPPDSAEPAKPATEATTQETKPADTQAEKPVQAEPAKPVERPWQEVLKSQQPDAILKELGFDDSMVQTVNELKGLDPKMINFLKHWKSGGDIKDYLDAATTDYSKMSDEDVMKSQLRLETAGLNLSEAQFEKLYQKRVVQHYKLNPDLFTEEEVEDGKLDLKLDAKNPRNALITRQNERLLPKAPEPGAVNTEAQAEEQAAAQAVEEFKSTISNSPYTKAVVQSKLLPIGEGEDKFNLELANPQEIIDLLYDNNKWQGTMFDDKGTPQIEKMLLISAFAHDPVGVIQKLSKHFRGLGGDAAIAPIQNAKKPDATASKSEASSTASPAAQMAKTGHIVVE